MDFSKIIEEYNKNMIDKNKFIGYLYLYAFKYYYFDIFVKDINGDYILSENENNENAIYFNNSLENVNNIKLIKVNCPEFNLYNLDCENIYISNKQNKVFNLNSIIYNKQNEFLFKNNENCKKYNCKILKKNKCL